MVRSEAIFFANWGMLGSWDIGFDASRPAAAQHEVFRRWGGALRPWRLMLMRCTALRVGCVLASISQRQANLTGYLEGRSVGSFPQSRKEFFRQDLTVKTNDYYASSLDEDDHIDRCFFLLSVAAEATEDGWLGVCVSNVSLLSLSTR